jgi:hypothetical protein
LIPDGLSSEISTQEGLLTFGVKRLPLPNQEQRLYLIAFGARETLYGRALDVKRDGKTAFVRGKPDSFLSSYTETSKGVEGLRPVCSL